MQLDLFNGPSLPVLADLVLSAGQCTACPLHDQEGGGLAFYDGTPNASLMIVAEAPGEAEAKQGTPLVGRSGQLLNTVLNAVGIDRSSIYITNVNKHRPANNRTPTKEEQRICADLFLRHEIDIVRPKIIVPLGNPATQFFLGLSAKIGLYRGKWAKWNDTIIFPMFHPAYVLRNPSREEGSPADLFWKDIQTVAKQLRSLG